MLQPALKAYLVFPEPISGRLEFDIVRDAQGGYNTPALRNLIGYFNMMNMYTKQQLQKISDSGDAQPTTDFYFPERDGDQMHDLPKALKGSPVKRVIPGEMIEFGTSAVCSWVNGKFFRDTTDAEKQTANAQLNMFDTRGVLTVNSAGTDMNACCFAITLGPQPMMNSTHTVLARLIPHRSNLDALLRFEDTTVLRLNTRTREPLRPLKITDCGVIALPASPCCSLVPVERRVVKRVAPVAAVDSLTTSTRANADLQARHRIRERENDTARDEHDDEHDMNDDDDDDAANDSSSFSAKTPSEQRTIVGNAKKRRRGEMIEVNEQTGELMSVSIPCFDSKSTKKHKQSKSVHGLQVNIAPAPVSEEDFRDRVTELRDSQFALEVAELTELHRDKTKKHQGKEAKNGRKFGKGRKRLY